ncbi:hypothetical protein GCM10009559_19170 [Pseudonocardia zijingensis]|uniref:Uncharacterized protein n=1 Tax=Pseudonocardia zijingensis TaxID=153376 RepID=A0ABN1PPC7_9PSEU
MRSAARGAQVPRAALHGPDEHPDVLPTQPTERSPAPERPTDRTDVLLGVRSPLTHASIGPASPPRGTAHDRRAAPHGLDEHPDVLLTPTARGEKHLNAP